MASAFAHALSAFALSKVSPLIKADSKLVILVIVCAIFPDIDVISFDLGIAYEHPFGHRGFTHSIFFSLIFALFIKQLFYSKISLRSTAGVVLFLLFFLCTASHGVLDGMTSGGQGVAYFFPFDNTRYFLPWRPIQVSPIGISNFISKWGYKVLKSEFIYVGIPSLILISVSYLLSLFRKDLKNGEE